MGKESACLDVPVSEFAYKTDRQHKKRGRPKTVRPQIESAGPLDRPSLYSSHRSEPLTYQAIRSWRGYGEDRRVSDHRARSSIEPPYNRQSSSRRQSPELLYPSSPSTPPAASILTLFAATSLQIVRASPECQLLTGYLPHEYINLSLYHYLHPDDVPIIEADRLSLVQGPHLPFALHSRRETLAAMAATPTPASTRSDRELQSPAEGMSQPYPNRNVRVLRADGEYDLYNIRLHIGGGLGASLWRAETFGRSYIVVSMLRLPPDVAAKFHRPLNRPTMLAPPTASRSVSVGSYPPSRRQSPVNGGGLSPLTFDTRDSLTISPIDQRSPLSPSQNTLPSLSSITATIPPPQHHAQMARSISGPGQARLDLDERKPSNARSLPVLSGMNEYRAARDRPDSGVSQAYSRHSDSQIVTGDRDHGGFTPRSAPLPTIDCDLQKSPGVKDDVEMSERLASPKRDLKRIWE